MSDRCTLRNAGDRAYLVDPARDADLPAIVDALRRTPPDGVCDVLPAARTVLVTLAAGAERASVGKALRDLLADERGTALANKAAEPETVTIPVRYDGSDLPDVAEMLGMRIDEVVAAHTSRVWRCAFLGFAPGFGYLEPDSPGLDVPRRAEARTAIPAGAVALADGYSAVYPRRSPGGWQIIGSTDSPMWDLDRPEPALLRPGTRVRFVDEGRTR